MGRQESSGKLRVLGDVWERRQEERRKIDCSRLGVSERSCLFASHESSHGWYHGLREGHIQYPSHTAKEERVSKWKIPLQEAYLLL